eukprot:1905800-Rhodomonas_salina.1
MTYCNGAHQGVSAGRAKCQCCTSQRASIACVRVAIELLLTNQALLACSGPVIEQLLTGSLCQPCVQAALTSLQGGPGHWTPGRAVPKASTIVAWFVPSSSIAIAPRLLLASGTLFGTARFALGLGS